MLFWSAAPKNDKPADGLDNYGPCLRTDTAFEGGVGYTFPGLYASMATNHMAKYGTTHDDMLRVAIKNHSNGALNPKAHFPMTIKT